MIVLILAAETVRRPGGGGGAAESAPWGSRWMNGRRWRRMDCHRIATSRHPFRSDGDRSPSRAMATNHSETRTRLRACRRSLYQTSDP